MCETKINSLFNACYINTITTDSKVAMTVAIAVYKFYSFAIAVL